MFGHLLRKMIQMIGRLAIPSTEIAFERRPSRDDYSLIIDIDSIEMCGISSEEDLLNMSRPILIKPFFEPNSSNDKKLFHIEFETNPLNTNADFRIEGLSQSLQITYHATTINKLLECFFPDRHHDLQGIKEAAYSIYTDIKNRTQFLVSENLKRIKDLDINIVLQSVYFIIPEHGYFNDSSSVICADFGRLIFKGGQKNIEHSSTDQFHDANEDGYVPIKIELDNIQLLYLDRRENWIEYRLKDESPSHLIKPITLTLDVFKSIVIDDPNIPIWKANGNVSSIESTLSDTRLFGLIKLIGTIPLPDLLEGEQDQETKDEIPEDKKRSPTTKQTYETIEKMTPIKKYIQEEEQQFEEQVEQDPNEQPQFIQLKASFQISKLEILFKRALMDLTDYTEDFLRISLLGIVVSTKIQTYDVQLNGYLEDFLIINEQFLTKTNEKLKLLSKKENGNFFQTNSLLTSTSNPQFRNSPYNSIENNINFKLNFISINFQFEPIIEIIQFQQNIFKKIQKIPNKNLLLKSSSSSTPPTPPPSSSSPPSTSTPSFKVVFDLGGVSVLFGNSTYQLIYIQLNQLNGFLLKKNTQISTNVILKDLFAIDCYPKSLYEYIIRKDNSNEDLINLELTLYTYPIQFKKRPKDANSFLKGNIQKLNILFLYKYIDFILSILNSFQSKQNQQQIQPKQTSSSSNEQSIVFLTLKKYQDESLRFNFDFELNGPHIFIPFSSYSYEGTDLDLGLLTMNTDFNESSSIENQTIEWQKLFIKRIMFKQKNQIDLLELTPLTISTERYLNKDNDKDLSINIQWNTIHFKLSKSDYAAIQKILQENFQEKIYFKIPNLAIDQQQDNQINHQQQQQQQDNSSNSIPNKNKNQSSQDENLFSLKLNLKINHIGLTLYKDEKSSQLIRNENSKFVCLSIEKIEAFIQPSSNSTYQGKFQIERLQGDDFKNNDPYSSLINKGFKVDQNTPTLTINLDFQTSTRKINGEMESFDIIISSDMISAMNQFLTYEFPSKEEKKAIPSKQINEIEIDIPLPAKSVSHYKPYEDQTSLTVETNDQPPRSRSSSRVPPSPAPRPTSTADVETTVEFVLKNSQLILIEDQKNNDSNCLVFSFSIDLNLINNGDDTKIVSSIKDLAFYGATFQQLKESKMKYSVIDPSQVDAALMINSFEQKIDINLGNLSISIDPMLIRTFVNLSKSIQDQAQSKPKTGKEKINSKSIFDPKPFKDSTFWFIQDSEEKDQLMEETDLLKLTTGQPSQKTKQIEDKQKEKSAEQHQNLSQQLIVNLKIIEIKFELGKGSSTRPVVAICLSNVFADIQNWSSDMLISSSLEMELALFNDHLLAWEPLIEPIIDQRGHVKSPFTIYCQTIQDDHQEENQQNRYLLADDEKEIEKEKEKEEEKEKEKEDETDVHNKKLISIRADHLLNLTLTKTTLDLGQQLQKMFNDAYQSEQPSDDDSQQAILSIHNQTGYRISIHDITGVEFPKDEKEKEKENSIELENNKTIHLTIPETRLKATHLPAIAEQVAKRKQQFIVQIEEKSFTVDINQTWRRVYELGPSPNPSWPIQFLCDSHLYQERRRIIISSIIKVSNRTEFPLVLLDPQSVETNLFHSLIKIDPNDEFYLPVNLLYLRSTARLYFSVQKDDINQKIDDFISFDWSNESTTDRVLKLQDGRIGHFVVYKEEVDAYSENTDEPIRKCFNIYVKLALHVINLLPIPVQLSIDDIEHVSLESGQLHHSVEGYKKSILKFTIPSYNDSKWISDPVDLNSKGHGDHNEHMVDFHSTTSNDNLRMIARVETFRGSYRVSFYAPYWIVNATDLKFQFKIENDRTSIDTTEQPYFIHSKKFPDESHKKKGHLRVYSLDEDETVSQWSESFSIDVIKSTGITTCKVNNDRDYMICIDIVTSSFGMTKIITLAPSTTIINNSTIDIEVSENPNELNEQTWKLVKADQVVPYWPKYLKEGVLYVRYTVDGSMPTCFSIKEKHRTLLRMDYQQRPAIHVEVTATDFDGYKVAFNDYQIGDAPLLIVNSLLNHQINFAQKEDLRTQVLPAQYYQYYTWMDPFKPRELILAYDQYTKTIQLNPVCGIIDSESETPIYYAVFYDGPQTVLMFSSSTSVMESVSDMPSTSETMKTYIQLSLHSVGLSVINDRDREDLLYLTINPSKELWTTTRKFQVTPVGPKLHQQLEENYKKYLKQYEQKSSNQTIENKFQIDKHRSVTFDGDVADISDDQGNSITIKREILDSLWIGYAQSKQNQAIHIKINHIQIDNQLPITLFPTMFYPIVSKAAGNDIPGKPFIELSVFKSESSRSNAIHIKYAKLLIQEFAACVDQGLIVGIMSFIKDEKNPAAPTYDLKGDLEHLSKPLDTILKGEQAYAAGEPKIFFDDLHLSPIKIHVSFSMHGAKPNEQLLAEYPIGDFLLQTLNIAEVQDVILKLNYYERKDERFTLEKLGKEIGDHYQNQLLKQIHVVVLGLDVLGNPFGVIRGVAGGVESFFYEPYKGAMEGPMEFLEGLATGTEYLVGSVVGGTAGALSKISETASKGLASMTLDQKYQNIRIQRKEIQAETTPEIVASSKNVLKDIKQGVKGVVTKPVQGAKKGGTKGFVKGLGKGFLGLIGRPTSGIADLTSTSFHLIKKATVHEEIMHRIRHPRHVGRDGIVRPSIAHETYGNYIFDKFCEDKQTEHEAYMAHINTTNDPPTLVFATTKRILSIRGNDSSFEQFRIEWEYHYKDIKGKPTVKFDPNYIQITLKETNAIGLTKKDSIHEMHLPYQTIGEARYIVDKILETMHILEV